MTQNLKLTYMQISCSTQQATSKQHYSQILVTRFCLGIQGRSQPKTVKATIHRLKRYFEVFIAHFTFNILFSRYSKSRPPIASQQPISKLFLYEVKYGLLMKERKYLNTFVNFIFLLNRTDETYHFASLANCKVNLSTSRFLHFCTGDDRSQNW